MRKSRISLGMASMIAVAGLTLAGCAAAEEPAGETTEEATETTEETTEEAAGGETFEVVALLPQGNDQPYGGTYIPPMEAKAEELGISLTLFNSGYDADQQASDCEVAVASEPDGIILWPAVAAAIRPCLEAANNAGIAVWVSNADINEEDHDLAYGYSGTDSYGQGAASAEMFCELAGDQEVGIIQVNGETGNSVAILRGTGFSETVAELCPNVTILAEQPGDWNKDTSQLAASEMLTAVGEENVQGIYAADDTMVAGAIAAAEARGMDVESLIITSIGNTLLGNPLVGDGVLDATVFQSSSWDGENAVLGIYNAMTGATELGRDDEGSVLYMPSVKVSFDGSLEGSVAWDDPSVTPEW